MLNPVRAAFLRRSALLLAAGAAFPGAGWASDVVGTVSDASGTGYLPGTILEIVELGRREIAGPGGSFRFVDIAPGRYSLRAEYSGADAVETPVTVPETGSVTVNVVVGAVEQGELLVIGQRANLASAISRQRASDTVDTILTRDAIGQFPDQNVAEAMRRAPGVNILNDQGEGRFVSVRGLDPNLNAASINGTRVPSPESDVRSVALDVIPSELVESIEIRKSLTPDMDADTIGASIEINTTSAFDRRSGFLAVSLEGSYNDLTDRLSPKASLDFSTRLSDNFGVSGGVSYYRRRFATDNIEMDDWEETDDGLVYAEEVEYRDYDVTRERIGASLGLDFRPSPSTTLFARGLYSRFDDMEVRRRLIFGLEEPSSGSGTTATFLSDDGEIEIDRDIKDRQEVQEILSLSVGGETNTGPWRLRYSGAYSRASELENGSVDPLEFRRTFEEPGELGVTFDYSNMVRPTFAIGSGSAAFSDPSEFGFNKLERTTRSDAEDEEWSARIDVTRTFALASGGTFELQFGGKARLREKTYDLELDVFDGFDGDFTLADVLGRASYGLFPIDPVPGASEVRRFLGGGFGSFELDPIDTAFESAVADFAVEEDIYAGYVLGRLGRGPLRAIGGVRVEHTRNDIRANLVELVEEGGMRDGVVLDEDTVFVTPNGFRRNYTHWLPSLNIRFEPAADIVLRAAAFRSVVRPNIANLAPRFIVEENDEGEREGEFGNPDLDPYRAWNFDLSAEYYFARNAVVQAGFFYKSIEDFIVDAEFEDVTFNGIFADEALIPINGDDARILGFEFAYQQALTFLPSPLDGLLVNFNYTFTDAEGDVNGRTIPLPASSRHTFNAILGYEKGPVSLRLAGAYRSSYLDELGSDAESDRYVRNHFQVDASARYRILPNVQLFAEWVNAFDEPYVAYQRGPGMPRLLQYEEYSWTAKFGARATF